MWWWWNVRECTRREGKKKKEKEWKKTMFPFYNTLPYLYAKQLNSRETHIDTLLKVECNWRKNGCSSVYGNFGKSLSTSKTQSGCVCWRSTKKKKKFWHVDRGRVFWNFCLRRSFSLFTSATSLGLVLFCAQKLKVYCGRKRDLKSWRVRRKPTELKLRLGLQRGFTLSSKNLASRTKAHAAVPFPWQRVRLSWKPPKKHRLPWQRKVRPVFYPVLYRGFAALFRHIWWLPWQPWSVWR